MPKTSVHGELRQLGDLFTSGTVAGMTDRELLDRFVTGSRAASETAFAALISRHGPMVLGVCRRALTDSHDVDDAFQATFLILLRKAPSVRVQDSLGRWLYGVSRKVARRARLDASRRPVSAGETSEFWEVPEQPRDEVGSILDEEIGRLPSRYGEAVRLCYLEGMALKDAAVRLGCPVGTVGSRLTRAKGLLRSRLMRRGLAPAGVSIVTCLDTNQCRAAVPEAAWPRPPRKILAKSAAGMVPASVAAAGFLWNEGAP